LVIVRLDIRVGHVQVAALNDGLDRERWIVSQSIGKDVSSGNFHRLLEKVVFKNDKAALDSGGVAKDVFPVLENLLDGRSATMNVEVICVKGGLWANASPYDRCKTHCKGNGTDAVVNVSEWWPHHVWSDTEDIFDDFLRPPEFCDNLFV